MRSGARASNAFNHYHGRHVNHLSKTRTGKNENDADCDHYNKISDWAGKAFNNYPERYVNNFSKTRNNNDAADHYGKDV